MHKRISFMALAAFMTSATAATALAADLAPPPPPAPQIRASINDWTGPYMGAVIGGTCMQTETTYTVTDLTANTTSNEDPSLNGCGLSGGFVYGFNYQFDQAVFGLEGDFTWGSRTGRFHIADPDGDPAGDLYDIKWQTSLRARVGWLMNNDTLLYVTGGPAWMRGTLSDRAGLANPNSYTRTHFGYAVGGGLEHAITENLHLRAEYIFSSFKAKNYGPYTCAAGNNCDPNNDGDNGSTITGKNDMDQFHTFRVGVTWNFPVSTW